MLIGYQTLQIGERQIAALLQTVTAENTRWVLDTLRRGDSVPDSVASTGLLYCPDKAGRDLVVLDGPALLQAGRGSCGSIAALEASLLRARAVLERRVPLPAAAGQYRVQLQRRPGTPQIDYWHAVVRTPGGPIDPTVGLRQVCPTPEYA